MKKGLLSWIALLLAAAALVMLHGEWMPQLPERVAVHFGGDGKANRWSSKSELSLGTLGVHLGTAGFIVLLTSLIHKLPPSVVNLPNPDYWRQPAHFPLACRYLSDWGRWFATAELAWACAMDHQLFLANLHQPAHLDTQATYGLLAAALVGTAVMLGLLLWRFRRVPNAAASLP